ncbi:tryptophan 7-halogenase [Simiduia litorea]|uniref:tryptophan halogenase family protein n=1 Tax=Simiduia litorea TaxID=1435348 RepID=UPI0036F309BF
MPKTQIEHIVIAGGGTAGWMCAAALAKHFENTPVRITLVESPDIGTIGVGEATIPTLRRFYAALGLSDAEVIRATGATCKLGIEFADWYKPNHSFIHPFGLFGQDVKGIGFHHYWLKMHQAGYPAPIDKFSLGVQLAQAGKFSVPSNNPPSSLSRFDWALHFDATAFAHLMQKTATMLGAQHIQGTIKHVHLRESDGFISHLELKDQPPVGGDLFIDCTGFSGLLIGKALGASYESWQNQLLCDKAVVVQTELSTPDSPPSFTQAKAHSAGWQWKIPLQTRQGNGHVFSSRFMDEGAATELLLKQAQAKPTQEPRVINFQPGRREKAWVKNCIALGLAAGFLEPLESTSIALIETGIEKIKLLFPSKDCDQTLQDEFNDMTRMEYERVRDFIILHYKLNQRVGEPFWDTCRDMPVPISLEKKMALFKSNGHLLKYRWEIFQNPSWIALYTGFHYLPDSYNPGADSFSMNYLEGAFNAMKESVSTAVAQAPTHQAYLASIMKGFQQ